MAHPPPIDTRPLPLSPPESRTSTSSDQEPDQDPVQMSIARQISVSRRQQAMLDMLYKQKSAGKRLNETKTSTPRIFNPWQEPELSPALHRMSERVVVEDV